MFLFSDLLLENFRNVNKSTQHKPNKATFNKYMNSVATVFPQYHLSNTDVGLLLPNACKHCTLSTVTISYWLLFPFQPHLISTGLQIFLHSASYLQSNSVSKYVVTPAPRDIIPTRVKENQANDICALSGFYAPYNGSLLQMFLDNLSVQPSRVNLVLEDWTEVLPKRR
jgi:hypothetical protein